MTEVVGAGRAQGLFEKDKVMKIYLGRRRRTGYIPTN